MRDLIEKYAHIIEAKKFGPMTQVEFFKELQNIDSNVFNDLTDKIDLEMVNHATSSVFILEGGGGTYKLDSIYEYCINEVATKFIEDYLCGLIEEDEAEVIDYADENPKTLDEAGL